MSPVGDVIGLDGRGFVIDGERLLSSIQANELDIPLDANHDFGEALGWFPQDSFELRSDGLYATLELNAKGIEANTNKSYRYLSPVYMMGNEREVTELDSVGFVNRPNLLNNALNNKEQQSMTIDELKAEIDGKLEAITSITQTINESITAFEENSKATKEEIDTIKAELDSVNEKVAIFAKGGEYDKNDNSGELSEGEKAAARALGLSEENYKNAKGGK